MATPFRFAFATASCLIVGSTAAVMVTPQPPLPTYTRALQLEPGADTSANVSIGDVNRDGKLDLVLIKGRHWPGMSRVLLGDGHGHFATAYDLTDQRYRSYSGHLADINGDSALDVVLSNDTPDAKIVLLNDGTGHFRRASTYGDASWPTRNAAVGDVNGDGRVDIVVANRGARVQQYICFGGERGQFTAPCSPFADYSATTITAADVNRDTHVDLVVPHRDGGQSYVYLNTEGAGFSEKKRIAFGPAAATIRMAVASDLDADGAMDIVAIDDTHKTVEIFYGTKAGGFAARTPLDQGVEPYALRIADLNRDGRPDVIVGFVGAPSAVFFGDGRNRGFTRVNFGDSRGAVYGFDVADLDGDGVLDIAAARSDAPNMVYFGGTR